MPITIKDAAGVDRPIQEPATPGRAAAAASVPTVLSTEDLAALNAVTTAIQNLVGYVDSLEGAQATGNTTLASIRDKIITAPATSARQDLMLDALTALGVKLDLGAQDATLDALVALSGVDNPRALAIQGVAGGAPVPVSGAFAIAASEANLGVVNSNRVEISAAPAVSTTPYSNGDVVGSKIPLANAARVAGGTGWIDSVRLNFKADQTDQYDVLIFKADPSGTTFTDNGVLALAAADYDKLIGVVHVTDATNLGTPSIIQALNVNLGFDLSSGTTLWAVIVSRGAPSMLSTSDLSISVGIVQN